ncbi:MAG: helix-turn-helix transcriptional regulator [Psychrobium sp.]|nr:helix-turn-helix transcriptional regulator [Psychrobium sp.]
MNIDSQILLFLSAFGALNGILLSLYFFTLPSPKLSNKLSNKFLAAMLLMFSIRILKSVMYYFTPDIAKSILQFGLSACFFIGPCLYFYSLSITGTLDKQRLKWPLHLGALLFIVFIVGFAYPYQQHIDVWGTTIYKIINYQWLVYLVLSLIVLRETLLDVWKKKLAANDQQLFTCSLFVGNTVVWLAYFTASYTSYIVGALSFSFIFCLMLLLIILKFRKNEATQPEKYANNKIIDEQADILLSQLIQLMQDKQLYKDANITMPQVAKTLGMSHVRLSQLLNDNEKKSFSLFINEYRIDAAKALLSAEKLTKMEVISEDCGFNSQSTFYSVFKKITGTTPAKYRAQSKVDLS